MREYETAPGRTHVPSQRPGGPPRSSLSPFSRAVSESLRRHGDWPPERLMLLNLALEAWDDYTEARAGFKHLALAMGLRGQILQAWELLFPCPDKNARGSVNAQVDARHLAQPTGDGQNMQESDLEAVIQEALSVPDR